MGKVGWLRAASLALALALALASGASAMFIDYGKRTNWPLDIAVEGNADTFELVGESLKVPALTLLYHEGGSPGPVHQTTRELTDETGRAIFDALMNGRARKATHRDEKRLSDAWFAVAARNRSGAIMEVTFYPAKNQSGTMVVVQKAHPKPSCTDEEAYGEYYVASRDMRKLIDEMCGYTPYARAELKKAVRIDVYHFMDKNGEYIGEPRLVGTIDKPKAVGKVTSAIAKGVRAEECKCPYTVQLVFTMGDGSTLEAYARYPGHSKKRLEVRAGNAYVSTNMSAMSPVVVLLK